MKTAIVNIGVIVSGGFEEPRIDGDAVLMDDGKFVQVGSVSDSELSACDVVIDAAGATAIPGLIDSQVHLTFGDYTPRQQTVGFLASYLHGGTTTSISASEVHVPGRPKDPAGVKALAVAAHKSFRNIRPGGMRVHGGSIIIEPGLVQSDFADVAAEGVWLAKAGFGDFDDPFGYVEPVAAAREEGLITTLHTGGASIPGSSPVTGEHLLKIDPAVSFHINGGPVAIEDKFFDIVASETNIAMQVCTAGNLRTTLLCAHAAIRHDAYARYLIATDTPTGTGVMPLGMIYTIMHVSSLTDISPEWAIAAATGNVADVYGLNSGYIAPGKDADMLVVDAPLGCTKDTALGALKNGDPFAIGAVVTDGIPRFVGRSRNTPPTTRDVKVAVSKVVQTFPGR